MSLLQDKRRNIKMKYLNLFDKINYTVSYNFYGFILLENIYF